MATTKKTTTAKAKKETPVKEVEAKEPVEVKEAPAKAKDEKKEYTDAELQDIIAKAVADAMAKAQPSIVQVGVQEEPVTLLFIGAIARGSAVNLGEWGQIYSDGGMIDVPKRMFQSGITSTVDSLLKERKLIVTKGLSDEERERFGVAYKENELLTASVYGKLLEYSADELAAIYKQLCDEHKSIVTKSIYSAVLENDPRVTKEKLVALIKIDRDERGIKESPLTEAAKRFALDID